MTGIRTCASALCGLMCVSTYAESPAWLDDWYEIEVIIFIQPDASISEAEGSTATLYAEDLTVGAPTVIEGITRAFPLTDSERSRLRERSRAVDLASGKDPWFLPLHSELGFTAENSNEAEIPRYGTFPDWMLPPGESYDPFFTAAFEVVPFGGWFADLSLASLVEKEEAEVEEDAQEEITFDEGLTDKSDELIAEPEIAREEILEKIEAFREELEKTSYIMDDLNVRLPRTAERMRSKGVHIVKHFNWHQYVPSLATNPDYVFFQSLEDYPTEGYFGVAKGRFIHFDVHLWIHQEIRSTAIRYPVYEIAELRRMKREDVHYIDHPKFGILAEVVKIELPPDLQDLWDSLD